MAETDRRVALMTGANKGIGLEVARQLAADHGLSVVIGARDEGLGEAAAVDLREAGADARAVFLDVTDLASIEAALKRVEGWFGRLDVLVNNAGIAIDDGPPSQISLETLRRTSEPNVFGAFTVTMAMLPLLKKSAAARIVNVSSGLGSLAQNSVPDWAYAAVKPLAYNSSKTTLNALTVLFAAELKWLGIKVHSTDPGYTATDLNHHGGHQTVDVGAMETVPLATLPDEVPTGGYFDKDGPVPW